MKKYIIVYETSLQKAMQFIPCAWDFFGITVERYYSYNVHTADYDFVGYVISPVM